MPEFNSRGLVGGFAIIRNLIIRDDLSKGTGGGSMWLWQVRAIQDAGNEIMGHSYTHNGTPADYDEFEYETITAIEEMRERNLNVVSFVRPGGWDGIMNSPAFYGTDEDLLLRANLKAYEAYIDTFYYRNLPVSNVWGPKPIDSDALSVAYTKTIVDTVIANGQGVTLNYHSHRFGSDGYITRADFEEVLDYIAAKVTAGDLVVMTPTQQLYATEAV